MCVNDELNNLLQKDVSNMVRGGLRSEDPVESSLARGKKGNRGRKSFLDDT